MTNVCIVGDGLASLTLAKALVNQGIFVDFFSEQKVKKIDRICVSSESKKIEKICKKKNIIFFKRKNSLSTSKALANSVILDFIKKNKCKWTYQYIY